MRGGNGSSSAAENPNAHIIEILGELAIHYGKTNDIFRSRSFRKAVSILKRQTKKMETAAQAKLLPEIGSSISLQIQEIVRTGHSPRIDSIKSTPADVHEYLWCRPHHRFRMGQTWLYHF